MKRSPVIAIFNVKYSPNLGDGLLAECLEAELRAIRPDVRIIPLDLAGREDYGQGSRLRHVKLAVLEMLPRHLRRYAAGVALGRLSRTTLAPAWRERLAGADAVIIGGGNLFADADLNFPMKLSAALAEATRQALPVAVHAVGVSDNWSPRGAMLFGDGLSAARLVSVTARDERSQSAWNRLLDRTRVTRAGLAIDPGLLTAIHFPAPPRTSGPPHIALGITDPLALRYHGGDGGGDLPGWFGRLIEALAAKACRISLFTNGSPEDRQFLARIAPRLIACAPDKVSVAPPCDRPVDFARFIGSCDLVMAHRMHACIAAYAYRIPTIGFTWDVKLRSFFELSERGKCILDPATTPPSIAAALARSTLAEGISAPRHDALVSRCRHDIAALLDMLTAAALPAEVARCA